MKASFVFTDGLENTATNSHYVKQGAVIRTSFTDLDPLWEAMQANSDCAMEKLTLSTVGVDPTESGAAGVYDSSEDKATMLFQAADGSTIPFDIAGPKASMFLADEVTINPAQAAVATLITEVLAMVITKGSAILVEYIRGYRSQGKPKGTKAGVVLKVP